MPELSEYRQRFIGYQAEMREDQYACLTGRGKVSDREYILSEYSDLFELSRLAELGREYDQTAEYRETERSGIQRLRAFAIEGYALARAADVSSEIDRYFRLTEAAIDEARIPLDRMDELVVRERDPKKRGELARRRSDLRAGAADLSAERLEIYRGSIRATGYAGFAQVRRDLRGCDPIALGGAAEKLLSKTESGYVSELTAFLPAAAGVSLDEASEADLDHLDYYPRFDAWFTPERLRPLYRELFEGLGFNVERQAGMTLAPINGLISETACFPVRVPEDIRLVAGSVGGQSGYRGFLAAAGRAQSYAWTSRNLQPEFRYVSEWGDSALSDCWAGLFAGLVGEELWLRGALGFIENQGLRRALRLLRLIGIRRHAALHLQDLEALESEGATISGSAYVNRMEDALKVRCEAADFPAGVSPAFRHGDHLRGAVLEYQLHEHLRTRFGSRWWASRKAGEMIIDLWNTGQRHSVEAMALMLGLGEPDYDWLAGELLKS